jgi:hypothetical protein
MRSHTEQARPIKLADGFIQRHHFLPKPTHLQNVRYLRYYIIQVIFKIFKKIQN